MKKILFILTILFCVSSPAHADEFYSVSDPKNETTIVCSLNNRKVEPGSLKGTPARFRALISPINSLKKRITRTSKKAPLKKQLAVLQKEYARQLKLCKQELPAFATPSPTPTRGSATPVGTTTPTLSPTPTTGGCSSGCFDSSRNTACFNIPAPVKGNEQRGAQLWSGSCAGCHSESSRRNRRYDQISLAFRSVPEMRPFSDDYNNQDIADLAAYLNRFNPRQCRTDWP